MDRKPRRLKYVNTHEAKTQLSKLVKAVEEDETAVMICRDGKPVAELRRVNQAPDPLKLHPEISKVVFHEDPALPADQRDWPKHLR